MNLLERLVDAPADPLARLGMDTSRTPGPQTGAAPNSWDNRPSWDNWKKANWHKHR